MISHPLVLEGDSVRLEPLAEAHITPLMDIAKATPDLFRYTSTPVTDEQAESYFERAFEEREQGRAYPFTLIHKPSDKVVGTSRFADIVWRHRNAELGFTWLTPDVQGTSVNVESKYLMLEHAFEALDFLRVHIITDTRNAHSQRAIRALGATYEGTLRAHHVAKGDYIRDTMVFSIIYRDWTHVKARLERRIAAKRAGEVKEVSSAPTTRP